MLSSFNRNARGLTRKMKLSSITKNFSARAEDFSTIVYTESDSRFRHFSNPARIQKMKFTLTDTNGIPLNINNADWQCTLEFQDKYPLRLTWNSNEGGASWVYFLAPRVTNDP